jgi:hypothetical protein
MCCSFFFPSSDGSRGKLSSLDVAVVVVRNPRVNTHIIGREGNNTEDLSSIQSIFMLCYAVLQGKEIC